ncbi:MAG: hypothetical protein AAFP89_12100 [Bacteroidota bacterium]
MPTTYRRFMLPILMILAWTQLGFWGMGASMPTQEATTEWEINFTFQGQQTADVIFYEHGYSQRPLFTLVDAQPGATYSVSAAQLGRIVLPNQLFVEVGDDERSLAYTIEAEALSYHTVHQLDFLDLAPQAPTHTASTENALILMLN